MAGNYQFFSREGAEPKPHPQKGGGAKDARNVAGENLVREPDKMLFFFEAE